MPDNQPPKKSVATALTWFRRGVFLCFWAAIFVFLFLHRKEITVERILNYTPKQPFLAALALLGLFFLKSVFGVLYGGIIFIASGLILPLPAAILVNALGAAIILSLPFFFGRRMGADALTNLLKKHPKLEKLQNWSRQNDRFLMMMVRIIGHLPSNAVSIYFGASRVPYKRYLFWSELGMLPSVIIFTVVGESLDDPGSPEFLIAAGCKLALTVLSLILVLLRRKKHAA